MLLAALPACLPSVGLDDTEPVGMVVIDTEKGIIPVPFDILKHPVTGLMNFPLEGLGDSLTGELYTNMNMLDGFITNITISIPFNFAIDPATLTSDNVKLYDLTDPTVPTVVDPESYYTLYNLEGRTEAPFYLTIINKSDGILLPPNTWRIDGRYALLLSKDITGKQGEVDVHLGGHLLFHFIKSSVPLFDEHNNLKTDLLDDPEDPTFATGLGMLLEAMRQLTGTALFTTGIASREQFPVVIPFSIKSNPEAIFLPGTSLGNQMATPNDLLNNEADPAATTLTVLISDPLDAATVNADNLKVFKLPAMEPVAVTVAYDNIPNSKGYYRITATPNAALDAETQYLAYVTADIKNSQGTGLSAGTYFALCRASHALVDENDVIQSSIIESNTLSILIQFGKDPTEAEAEDWSDAHDTLVSTIKGLEQIRTGYKPLFDGLATAGVDREKIVNLWTFTTGQSR